MAQCGNISPLQPRGKWGKRVKYFKNKKVPFLAGDFLVFYVSLDAIFLMLFAFREDLEVDTKLVDYIAVCRTKKSFLERHGHLTVVR